MSESHETSSRCTELRADWFRNSYLCPDCGAELEDEWSCMCNDRCPECDVEIEPSSSEDLSRPLSNQDYSGAAYMIFGSEALLLSVTDEEAKGYAEALMEGDPDRFEYARMARPQQLSVSIGASGAE